MGTCKTHEGHPHMHGPSCGHKRVKHDGHEDFLHDGHMHNVHGDHVDEHELGGTPGSCTPQHSCGGHAADHKHGPGCGHDAVPHAGHIDYVVGGHLHHHHGSHCDDHGAVSVST